MPRPTISQRPFGVALALVMAAAPGAGAGSLAELLAGVEANARFMPPARAEVRIECEPACTATRAVLAGRDDALRIEVKDGMRALVRPGGIVVAEGARVADAPAGKALADTAVLLEDLRVFLAASLKVPQISDDGPGGVVVTGAPAGTSAYALLVFTVDPERRAIVKTQYYRDSISNLAKVRRDTGFTQVGGRWRPGEVAFESVRGATTRLLLTWREAADVPPALFEPSSLERPGLESP